MGITLKQAAQLAAGSACLTGAGTLFYANQIEAKRFQLETVRLTAGGGKQRNHPYRILHLSDLHLCHPESEKIEFLRKITAEEYDLILITGDIFENFTGITYASELITRPPKLGAYAVLGNHDYYNYTMFNKTFGRLFRKYRNPSSKRDVTPMIAALEKGGIRVLRHAAHNLAEDKVHIVGIDYPSIEHARLRALVGQAHKDDLVIILFHVPMHLDRISTAGAHLAVGGHTHGGQIRLPGYGALYTDSELPGRQASGLFLRGRTTFHISRGLGADPRSNIRLFCPPAATVIEVHPE
jgi:predicted MPP superfamily phosphohydrolase